MTHSIHPDAEAELGDAAVYYATHASGAIAEAFLAEYERVRDLIIQNQQRGPHAEAKPQGALPAANCCKRNPSARASASNWFQPFGG